MVSDMFRHLGSAVHDKYSQQHLQENRELVWKPFPHFPGTVLPGKLSHMPLKPAEAMPIPTFGLRLHMMKLLHHQHPPFSLRTVLPD